MLDYLQTRNDFRGANEPAEDSDLQRRDISTVTLQVRSESIDEKSRSVEAVLATENPVTVFDWETYEPVDEILLMDGMRTVDYLPMLDNHRRWSNDDVIGSLRNFRAAGTQLVCSFVFADMSDHKGDDEAQRIERTWTKVKQRHLREVSVGYRVYEAVRIPAGETGVVRGRTYTAKQRPLRIALDWLPREGSVTPVGADMGAKLRKEEAFQMNELLRYVITLGLRADATMAEAWAFVAGMTDLGQRSKVKEIMERDKGLTPPAEVRAAMERWDQRSGNQNPQPGSTGGLNGGTGEGSGQRSESGQGAGQQNPGQSQTGGTGATSPNNQRSEGGTNPAPGISSDEVRRLLAEERERADMIARMFSESQIDNPDLQRRAVREGWTQERTAMEILPLVRQRSSEPLNWDHAPAGHIRSAPSVDALGLAMMLHNGRIGVDQRFDNNPLANRYLRNVNQTLMLDVNSDVRQRAMEDAHRLQAQMGARSLFDFCRLGLQLSGARANFADGDELIRSALSSAAVQAIFTTDVNARLIASYNFAPDTTRVWCREDEVADFKINTGIVMGTFGALTRHSVGKQADSMDVGTETFNSRIFRYTGRFEVDEMDIINDRFGALEQHSPEDIGRSANQVRPSLVYSLLLANPNFNGSAIFSAGRGNLFSGASDALSENAIEAAEGAMGDQRIGNRVLDLPLKFIIVPRQLKFGLKRLLNSVELRDNTPNKEYGTYNPLSDEDMTGIYDSRIGTKGVTDPLTGIRYTGTATNWFAITDRNQAARTVVVNYRRGTNRAPTMRSYMMNQGKWGFGWDINLDIGADFEDFRGVQRHAGA